MGDSKQFEFIPFHKPEITEDDRVEVMDALASGWLSKGPKVIQFEGMLGEYLGVDHVVSCNSGTAALHLALLAIGIGPGDEVIVPSFTFCSSVNVILHVGATPIFVDINEQDLCLDVQDVERKITSNTRAVIAVHFAGYPVNLDALGKLCKSFRVALIEDAAHALGTKYGDRRIGTHGDVVCFSFYATKNITTGEGGALVTRSEELAEKARLYGWHGITKTAWNRYGEKGSWKYDVLLPGYKYNMSDMQAALGITQLRRADAMMKRRADIAAVYTEQFLSFGEYITLPKYQEVDGLVHAWHLFVIRLNEAYEDRDTFIHEMRKHGIGLSVHFIPVHMHPYYQENFEVKLPNTEKVFRQIVSLPLYPSLRDDQVEHIVQSAKTIILKS